MTEWAQKGKGRKRKAGCDGETRNLSRVKERENEEEVNGAELHSFSRLTLIWQDTHRWAKESEGVRVCVWKRERISDNVKEKEKKETVIVWRL